MSTPPAQSNRPAEAAFSAPAPENDPHPPPEHYVIVPQDVDNDNRDEADPSLDGDAASSTASVSSSILEYRRLQGRTYHSNRFTTNYFLPNDDQQLDSVDLTHHYLTILLDDNLYLPPLQKDKLHRVLDVGTGTVTGTDLSPCQPSWVPPNVSFEIDDATLDWTWDDNSFDFTHIRYVFGAMHDWNALLKEAYRCCAPGGWVQSCECDVEFRSDDGTAELEPVLKTWGQLFREGGNILGRPFFVQELQQEAFDKAGFIEKKSSYYKIPIGGWPKDPKLAEVGRFVRSTLENDLEGYSLMMWQDVLGRPKVEYQVWLATLRKAIRNPKVHSYMIVHYIYGRKPE